jgi:hypothetical protein
LIVVCHQKLGLEINMNWNLCEKLFIEMNDLLSF